MELAVEVDDVVLPEQAHHLDLLGLAPPAIGEGFVERNELDGIPPRPDAETEPVPRQHGELGRLLGDEHGLALGQDQDRRDQLEAPCDGGDEAEHRERLMERGVLVVGAFEAARPLSLGADDVVVDEQVGCAELLQTLRVGSDGAWVGADLAVGEHGAELHLKMTSTGHPPLTDAARRVPPR